MADIGHFDADQHDPNAADFTPMPAGVYDLIVSNSDIKVSKDKPTNKYIALELTVVEGEFKGRKIFDNLNLWNDNKDAVRLAESRFSALCRATGKRQIKDTVELHSVPFKAQVGVKPAKGEYKPKNEIEKYIHNDGEKATATAAGATAAASGVTPWQS